MIVAEFQPSTSESMHFEIDFGTVSGWCRLSLLVLTHLRWIPSVVFPERSKCFSSGIKSRRTMDNSGCGY